MANYSNRKWVIVNLTDVTDKMVEDCIQTSRDTLRKSLDESKVVLKYSGNKPRSLYGKTTYSHSGILEVLSGEEWTDGSV